MKIYKCSKNNFYNQISERIQLELNKGLCIIPGGSTPINAYHNLSKKNSLKSKRKILLSDERRNKVVNIPNGVKIREITLSRLELLKDLKLDLKNRPLFSTIALLEERKGHIWLLKAIKKLKESNIDSDASPFFIFEGNGSTYSILNNYILDNKLEDYIKIFKEIPNIFNLINASDAIILPSIFMEDFPNIIIEAMSLGKPVIGTKIAGIPEQIDHHKNGCLVSPNDVDGLYDSIIHLMNKDVRETYGIQSKHKYNENYKVEISINKYIHLYNLIK